LIPSTGTRAGHRVRVIEEWAVRNLKPLVIVAVLLAFPPLAVAQGIPVLVEPFTPTGGKPANVFRGTLLNPTKLVLLSADGNTAATSLDLSKVLVLYFPTEELSDLEAQITKLKADIADKKNVMCKDQLIARLIAVGKRKAIRLLDGIKAVTTYNAGVFKGHLDETKAKVKFLIEKPPTSPTDTPDPPAEFTWDQLQAVYFLPPLPPKAEQSGLGPAQKAGTMTAAEADAWFVVAHALDALCQERTLLSEQFTAVSRRREALEHMTSFEWDSRPRPVSKDDLLAQLNRNLLDLRQSIRAKDFVIEQYRRQLAYLPRPLPEQRPEPYEAFPRKPCVKPVPECDSVSEPELIATTAGNNPYGSLQERIARSHSPAFNTRFAQLAHFPMPRFGLWGERLDAEGVVIYEGMRFVATRDGQYEVSFTASAPKMAVTLRLQLVFARPEGHGFTLTLPPIVIDPKTTSFAGNNPGESYQVYHAGYSHLVAEHFADLCSMQVARHGTARFGSWPEGINRFQTLISSPVLVQPTQATATPAPAP
jgi:hypothetical protein